MQNRTTLPPIQPHTEAKHDILRYHMRGWFPILGRPPSSGPLRYIDGFAGPGEYEGGEPGSPIIALETIATHTYVDTFIRYGRNFEFLFVERDQDFFQNLQRKVSEVTWPTQFAITMVHDEFESVMVRMLDEIDSGNRRMPPTLLFIDPFGSAGFTMGLLKRLAQHPRIDILINFNWNEMRQWILPDPVKHITLDGLYGSDRWRPALRMMGVDRQNFLIREYGQALQAAGWRNNNFEMINKQNQTQYYLFFATRSPRGMEVIKRAMRRVSPDGLYRYADRTDPAQLRFIAMGMEFEYAQELAEYLFLRYRGCEVPKQVIIDDDIAWHPRWLSTDLNAGLKSLESSKPPRITNVRNFDGRPRRRPYFPDGCIITFAG